MAKYIPKPKQIDLRIAADYTRNLSKLRVIYGSDTEIKREYRRLQAAVSKRLKREIEAGYGESPYARELSKIKPVKQLSGMEAVARELNRAYTKLTDQRYTLAGIREGRAKGLKTMIDKGMVLPGASRDELDTLFRAARRRGFIEQYGSDKVNEIYRTRQEKGLDTNYTDKQWQGVLSAAQVKLNRMAEDLEGVEI